MRYGLPYKGSKNHIVEWLVRELPGADVFCDIFFGGGAVTHRALLSGKYRQFVCNDIDGRLVKFFLDSCFGKYTLENHKEWISREEFFRLKEDIYIALIWSFANNGVDYLYAKNLEPLKKALHYAVFFDNLDLMKEQGILIKDTEEKDIYKRYLWFKHQLTNIESLARLQSLQSDYVDAYEKVNRQYNDILVYCDPPYSDTNCGKYKGFDNNRFYEWAKGIDNIYISEYNMPEDFIPVAQVDKRVLSAGGNNKIANEKLFTNKKTYKKLNKEKLKLISLNFAEQMSLF